MTKPEESRWNDYNKIRLCDPEESIMACKPVFIKSYLYWRVKHSRIRKLSSILTYWNVLSNWIYKKLGPEFDLDTSKKEKTVLYMEDLDLILYYHWVHDEYVY
ncbi:unnamed protein product [Clonostachys rosea f. rosea IK726]|uniref:Uncharacterized protein n=1 Tax=Clonostachys rosea f. rosea IK726 TaxID=1349383 RepID=A0ACA9TLZ4_BIOOC|nr:unnamed protein product [Clonostachys rosea f. rosea IK726]